jgi:hypothetical protein
MTIRVERDRIANAPAETTEEVKITPKLVSAGERETTIMAKAIYEAFYETRNGGIVSGEPAPLESTLIDGSFYFAESHAECCGRSKW